MLTWTTDKPTQPGWYWFTGSCLGDEFTPVIVFVGGNEPSTFDLFGTGDEVLVSEMDGRWAGPIEMPSEPDFEQIKKVFCDWPRLDPKLIAAGVQCSYASAKLDEQQFRTALGIVPLLKVIDIERDADGALRAVHVTAAKPPEFPKES